MTEPYATPSDTGESGEEALVTAPSYVQLTQQRVPLRRAAETFATPDDAGRYPIVVLVKQGGRFQVEVLLVAGAVAAAAVMLPLGPILDRRALSPPTFPRRRPVPSPRSKA